MRLVQISCNHGYLLLVQEYQVDLGFQHFLVCPGNKNRIKDGNHGNKHRTKDGNHGNKKDGMKVTMYIANLMSLCS